MRKFFRTIHKSILIIALSLFLLCLPHRVLADSTDINATTSIAPQSVDENTPTVTITFSGLDPSTSYNISGGIGKEQSDENGTISVTVCGDGSKLKITCDSSKDYFNAGDTYTAEISKDGETIVGGSASFYVTHLQPSLSVATSPGAPGQIIVSLQSTVLTAGGKNNSRNNYAAVLQNTDSKSQYAGATKCITYDSSDAFVFADVPEGHYTLSLYEQVDDASENPVLGAIGNLAGEVKKIIPSSPTDGSSCHAGGFEYLTENANTSTDGVDVEGLTQDPKGVDQQGLTAVEQNIGDTPTPMPPPCPSEAYNTTTGECDFVNTGLGIVIHTDPAGFVESVFGILLGISGTVALLLIIYSGYQMITSRGKPETLQAARDRMTSAIVGLLFLIFSLAILQIIGVDILHIPGLTSNSSYPSSGKQTR